MVAIGPSGLSRWMLMIYALKVVAIAVVKADCIVWNVRSGFLESGGKLYVLGGWDGQDNSLREHDIASRMWTELSPSPGAPPSLRNTQGFAVSNRKLYVFRGDNGSDKNDLYEYDIALGTWTDLSSPIAGAPPSGRISVGVAGSNGKLYVFRVGLDSDGSDESTHKQALHEYDIASGMWRDLSSPSAGTPPSARSSIGFSELNGKLYVFEGNEGSNQTNLHQYDIASGIWVDLSLPRAGTPPPGRHRTGFAASSGKLYVFGGAYESSTGDLHEYDIETSTWTELPSVGSAGSGRHFIGFAASDGKVYCFAAWADGSDRIDHHVYDIVSGSWTDLSSPRAADAIFGLHLTGFLESDGKLYVFGTSHNFGQNSISDELHEYTITSGSWTDLSLPRAGTPASGVGSLTKFAAWKGKLYVFGGPSTTDQYFHKYDIASRTWTDLSPWAPAPRAMGIVASAGKLYVFGFGLFSNNLQEYDIASGKWTESPTAGTPPSARAYMGFAESNGTLYVFGGWGLGEQFMNDLHKYDVASGTWTDMSFSSAGTPPTPRNAFLYGSLLVESNGKLYLFGGSDGLFSYKNELHEFDIVSSTWTDLSSPLYGTPPKPSNPYHTFFAASSGKLFSFGFQVLKNVLHEYDITTRSWKGWTDLSLLNNRTDLAVQRMGQPPSSRAAMGFAHSNDNLYVFGGLDGSLVYKNDLHEFDISSGSWTDLSFPGSGVAPSVRAYMGFEAQTSKLYLFGGKNGAGALGSFFVYDIARRTWTDLSSPSNGTPPARRAHLGFAEWGGKFYVFGGADGSTYMNDLHQYDIVSGTWTDLSTPNGGTPPMAGISGAAMGFVQSSGKLFVFGRVPSTGEGYSDLHEYDIALGTWTDLASPNAGTTPSARVNMGFVDWNAKLYVFGGQEGNFKNDLHEYDISLGVWTDLSFRAIGTQPSDRAEMGFAASNGKVYVFGGRNGYGMLQELHMLRLDCTPDDIAGCFSCGRGLSGNLNAPESMPPPVSSDVLQLSTPTPVPSSGNPELSSGEVEVFTSTTSPQSPTPTSWQLEVLTTMVGITAVNFGNSARRTFKSEVANLFSTSTAIIDITIVNVTDTTVRRMLLAAAIQVEYVIGGFSSSHDLATAATRIEQEETQTYLAAMLRFSSDFSNLTSLVSKVSLLSSQTDSPVKPPPADTNATSPGGTDSVSVPVSPPAEEQSEVPSSTRFPIGVIIGGSFGALVLLLAAGFFCWVAVRGGGKQAPVIQIPTNRDDARFEA